MVMDGYNKVVTKEHLYSQYKKLTLPDSSRDENVQKEEIDHLDETIKEFLQTPSTLNKLTPLMNDILTKSLQACKDTDEPLERLQGICKAFLYLENYALNLVKLPWKTAFFSIRFYSGFLQVMIEKYLRNFDTFFTQLGYEKKPTEYILTTKLNLETKIELAFDCRVAHLEMKVFEELYGKVHPFAFTIPQLAICRQKFGGNIEDSTTWLQQNFNDPEYVTLRDDRVHNNANSDQCKTALETSTLSGQLNIGPNSGYHHFTEYDPGTPQTLSRNSTVCRDASDTPHTSAEKLRGQLHLTDSAGASGHQEWKEVHEFKERLGPGYNDPGGRGDILSGNGLNKLPPANDDSSRTRDLVFHSSATPYVEISSKKPEEKTLFKLAENTQRRPKRMSNVNKVEPISPGYTLDTLLQSKEADGKRQPAYLSSFGHSLEQPSVDTDRRSSITSQERFVVGHEPSPKTNFQTTAKTFYSTDDYGSPFPTTENTSKMRPANSKLHRQSNFGVDDEDDNEREANKIWHCHKCSYANDLKENTCTMCGYKGGKI